MFLSTPPSRVATYAKAAVFSTSKGVSIHATLAGGDDKAYADKELAMLFLSTPPSRVATGRELTLFVYERSFYPRHPRGWRRDWSVCRTAYEVSIHATLAGGDCASLSWVFFFPTFLSTPPSRVATQLRTGPGPDSAVRSPRDSLHAPLAGGDPSQDIQKNSRYLFLSTPPSRVATPRQPDQAQLFQVSIHATLAGGDSSLRSGLSSASMFLSTPPSRVATLG